MLVSEILRIKGNTLFTIGPESQAMDAVRVMAQHDIGSLVVMDHALRDRGQCGQARAALA